MSAPALDQRIRDWDDGNLFFQAVVGLASFSSDLQGLLDRYVPGAPPREGDPVIRPDDPFVLALVGAVHLQAKVDAALAEAGDGRDLPASASPGGRAPLRTLLR